jgi:hypothetical protein
MNALSRLIVAIAVLTAWRCWMGPVAATALRAHRAQRHAVTEAPVSSPREAPLVRAIWGQVPAAFKSAAIARAAKHAAPPLSHDSRYANPDTHALIAAIIEHYGFEERTQGASRPPAPRVQMSTGQTLRATRAAVEAGELSPTEAAAVLALARQLAAVGA